MDKLLGILGLARRAGKLDAGFDLCTEKIREGKAKAAFAAEDISEKSFKNIVFEAQKEKIPAHRLNVKMKDLSKACGIKAGIIVITDEGFANKIEEIIAQD